MDYKLYTLVDITHTRQYRSEPGKEIDRCREQNFNTVIQTLGIRANVHFRENPFSIDVAGKLVGFDTDEIIRLWRFDFSTEREDALYEVDSDPVGYLKQDFHLVPYISGLGESMEQKYAVFNTQDPGKNIVFHLKQ
jgi:hypothetical protein